MHIHDICHCLKCCWLRNWCCFRNRVRVTGICRFVGFEVIMAVAMISSVFWFITQCSYIFSSAYYLFHAGFFLGLLFYPEDGGDMFFWNFGFFPPGYTALHPKTQRTLHIIRHNFVLFWILGDLSYYLFRGVEWDWVHLVRRPLIRLLHQPLMIDEYGAFDVMRIGRGNRSTRRTTVCSPSEAL
jgi:hypothetical protein